MFSFSYQCKFSLLVETFYIYYVCIYFILCDPVYFKAGKASLQSRRDAKQLHQGQDDEAKECHNCAATLLSDWRVLWRALWIERYAVSTMHTKNNGLASTIFPLNWLKDIRYIYIYIYI